MTRTISAGKTPRVEVETIAGDLNIVGWESDGILVKAEEDKLRLEQDGERVRVSCDDDLSLRVPREAAVSIRSVGGDMALKSVMGSVTLNEVNGDVSIRDVNSVSIETIHADLSLRGAKGSVSVRSVGGDASLRAVDGPVTLENVGDDLVLRDARGNLSANVGEDVILYLNPQAGNVYSVTAGDDILLVMSPGADAALTLNGDSIEVDWEGVAREEDATSRQVTLGSGSAKITLNAGGDIRVTSQADAGETAEDFGNFAGVGQDWSGLGERISRRVEAATRRATQKAEVTARRVEAATRRAEEKMRHQHGHRFSFNWTAGRGAPTPPTPPTEPVSDEERMTILRMLQEKKISSEEAETLLAALEGGN